MEYTVHFRGAGLRKGIGTIIDIDCHTYKIGQSGTWVTVINDKLMYLTSTTTSKHRLKVTLSQTLKTSRPKSNRSVSFKIFKKN